MSYYPVPELVILLPFLMDFIIDIPVSLSIAIFFLLSLFVCLLVLQLFCVQLVKGCKMDRNSKTQ